MSQYSLYINILSLILGVYMMYRSYKKDNFIALLYWGVLIFLVIGQAIYISLGLLNSNTVQYLYNIITVEGHFIASIVLFFIIIAIIFLDRIYPTSINFIKSPHIKNEHYVCRLRYKYCEIYYMINWILLVIFTVSILHLIGFHNWISSSRPMAHGSTFLLMLISFTIYPLLIKVASGLKSNVNDKLLYLITVVLTLSFSRILAIFYMLMLATLYIYSNKPEQRPLSLKKYKFVFISMGFVLFLMMFVYGAYRDTEGQIGSANLSSIYNHIIQNPKDSLFSLNRNYKVGIEGMSGFSGILSTQLNMPLKADFGFSAIVGGVLQLIPSWFRTLLGNFPKEVNSFYYYHKSVVGGGLEAFFIHFSFFGFLLYPFVFFLYAYYLHKKMIFSRKSHNFGINERNLEFAVLAVLGLEVIRGSSTVLVAFTISQLIIMYIAVNLFERFYQFEKAQAAHSKR